MNPVLMGIITGVVLALLNFLASAFYSSKVISCHSKMTSIGLVLIGFVTRLTLLSIIFYGLTKIKWIHFQTSLVAFLIFFTLCAFWKAARAYREAKPLVKQQTEI